MTQPTTPSSMLEPERVSRPGEPTWEIACLFPAQGDWTVRQYLDLDTNWLIEYTDGCVTVLPMPTLHHQLIVKDLYGRLNDFVVHNMSGTVFFAPLPIKLGPRLFREPDIVFLRPERMKDLRGQPEGADLVMEVVSEGLENRKRDLDEKPSEYAAGGIFEYWIVDPQQRHILVLTLEGSTYREHGPYGLSDSAPSVLLPGFSVPVGEVFAVAKP